MRILLANRIIDAQLQGSWNQRFARLLEEDTLFDAVIGPGVPNGFTRYFPAIKKQTPIPNKPGLKKLYQIARFNTYIAHIKKLAKKHKNIQWVVIDDWQLVKVLHNTLENMKVRQDHSIIFSFHGFSIQLPVREQLYTDKLLFLTTLGYQATKQANPIFLPEAEIIGNAVKEEYYWPSEQTKQQLRKKWIIPKSAKVILWASHNRPKKGTHILEKIKQRVLKKYPLAHFIVVGTDEELREPDCYYSGVRGASDLSELMKLSDIYLFTTLCNEGFGLTLAEALRTGNICIASDRGGVPEVLQQGELGLLVSHPNIPEAWLQAIDQAMNMLTTDFLEKQAKKVQNLYTYNQWSRKISLALQ